MNSAASVSVFSSRLAELPKVAGNLVIITCGDITPLSTGPTAVRDAMQAPWAYIVTRPGGTRALTVASGGVVRRRLAVAAVRREVRAVEAVRGEGFCAVVDLQHLVCAAHGFRGVDIPIERQRSAISASQVAAAPVLGKAFGLPIYQLKLDPRTGFWW